MGRGRLGTNHHGCGPTRSTSLRPPPRHLDQPDRRRPYRPGYPLPLQLLNRYAPVVQADRRVPVSTSGCLQEGQEPDPSPSLDQKPHQRNTLGVKSQHRTTVGRVLRHPQQLPQRNPAAGLKQLHDGSLLASPLGQRLGQHRRTLVSPAGDRTTEAAGEYGVSQLVRQDGSKHLLIGALQGHLPTKDLATTKTESRRTRSAKMIGANQHATGRGPSRHLVTQPSHRQLATMNLRGQRDPSRQRTRPGRHDEVRCLKTGRHQWLCPAQQAHRHRHQHPSQSRPTPRPTRTSPHPAAHDQEPPCSPRTAPWLPGSWCNWRSRNPQSTPRLDSISPDGRVTSSQHKAQPTLINTRYSSRIRPTETPVAPVSPSAPSTDVRVTLWQDTAEETTLGVGRSA